MKKIFKYIVISILAIGVLIGASYAFGWVGVLKAKDRK
jgi:hypothetical protein